MAKLIALLRKAPHLSREEMIRYYETKHVPLIRSIVPGILDYRRNYLEEPIEGCDILTEITFADRTSYDAAMAAAAKPDAAQRIANDEENFLDRSATRLLLAEERR